MNTNKQVQARQGAEQTHTPTPWEVQQLSHARDELWLQIGYAGYGPIVELNCTANPMKPGVIAESKWMATSEENQRANAAFIVRACNAHDDLVAALKMLDDDWTKDFPNGPDGTKFREGCSFADSTLAIWRAARAALAKAGA